MTAMIKTIKIKSSNQELHKRTEGLSEIITKNVNGGGFMLLNFKSLITESYWRT